jgi:hypothetical protein
VRIKIERTSTIAQRIPFIDSLDILEDTKSITFNSAALDITDASAVDIQSGVAHAQVSRLDDEKQERVSLHFSETFAKGSKVQLLLGWQAVLGNSMMGG